jgi:flagellin-like hook-associated protein FlgL
MKKLMWFLIGFSLVAFPARFVFADYYPSSDFLTQADQYFDSKRSQGYQINYVGFFIDATAALTYFQANHSGTRYSANNIGSMTPNPCVMWKDDTTTDVIYYGTYTYDSIPTSWSYSPDVDDDGIPDECDFYPDDSGKLNTYTVDWVTVEESTGTEVAWGVQTPYSDGFTLGDTSVDGSTPGYKDILYYQTDGNWYELPADCSSGSRAIDGTRDLNDKQVVEYTWTGDEYEDTPGPGTDGAPVEGTDYSEPTGTETDSEALQVIAQNTAAGVGAQNLLNENIVAGNSELNKLKINSEIHTKQGEELKGYLQDLNTAAGTLDTSVQALETAIDENMDVPQADIDQSVTNAGDIDTEYGTAQTSITGDATLADDAPLDYQEKTNIATKMADYITSNPISDIIENSGLTISGASPTAIWNYNGQSMVLTVAGFDTALEAFGQILLGIFTLAGMLLIFRG